MNDTRSFEQQLAGGLDQLAGPRRSVDAMAISREVIATQSPKWRFQSMFSATKFVVAGAILALFGGFLLAGVLTQQSSDEQLPAVGASASATAQAEPTEATTSESEPTAEAEADDTTATPDLLPGVDLVTEEVEPGVYRVLSDGVREISVLPADEARYLGGIMDTNIAAGPDGSVWLFGLDRFFRLGAEVAHEWDEEPWKNAHLGSADIEVGPDGRLWLHHYNHGGIWSFDGQTWTSPWERKKDERLHGVEVQPDGTVWTFWSTGGTSGKNKPKPRATAARLGTDGWQNLPGKVAKRDYGEIIVADSPGGEVWLVPRAYRWSGGRLHRHDGSGWVAERTPKAGGEMRAAIGADGTLWVRLHPECGPGTRGNTKNGGCGGPSDILARYDGEAWEVFRPKDGIPMMGDHYQGFEGFFEVAPDRSIWFNPIGDPEADRSECDGVANFDGQALRRYLRDHCIVAMDMAPDGTVWLRATQFLPDRYSRPEPTDLFHTYVITPEAVATTE